MVNVLCDRWHLYVPIYVYISLLPEYNVGGTWRNLENAVIDTNRSISKTRSRHVFVRALISFESSHFYKIYICKELLFKSRGVDFDGNF